MSVPEGKRCKGKLTIETEAEALLNYIIDITTRYYYPPDVTDSEGLDKSNLADYVNAKWFAERMRVEALDCLSQIQEANKTVVKNDESFYKRRSHQGQAERSIERVLTAATLLYRKKLMKSKRIKYIGEQVGHLKRMIQNWRKSDSAKYSSEKEK